MCRRLILTATLALAAASPPTPAAAADLSRAGEAFRPYAAGLIDRLLIGTEELARHVEGGDLEAARRAWRDARVGWERGETFLGEYFPEHDEAIDVWPDAERGFHAIEPLLFKAGDVRAAAPLTERLLTDVRSLNEGFGGTELEAQGLINGLAGISFEIGGGKIDGGESPFAGTSLDDMRRNMQGIEALYALAFADAVEAADPALHERVVARMIDLASELDRPMLGEVDRSRVMALSERLAGDWQDVAAALGLERPRLGG